MTQRWDDARKTFANVFSVPPESAIAYLMFGKFLVQQRLEDRAVPEIQAALQRDPRLAMAHFLLGEIDLYKGDASAAVEELNKEVAINPTVWLVYWRLGDAYVRLERYEEAEKVLKEAIWLNETSSGAYILLGQVALKRDDARTAAGVLERAVKLDPQNDYVHYFLAKAYQGLGRTAEANQHFAIAEQLVITSVRTRGPLSSRVLDSSSVKAMQPTNISRRDHLKTMLAAAFLAGQRNACLSFPEHSRRYSA